MPILAASLCGLWSLSRISYTFGYLSGEPKKVRWLY
jgi:glutathione S-transferase